LKHTIALLCLLLAASLLPAEFMPGERLTYKVKYGAITAGEATRMIREDTFRDTTPVWRITSQAGTNSFFDNIFKVRDEIESIWEKNRRVSVRFTKKLHEGNYRQLRTHSYYPDQKFSIYSRFNFKRQTYDETRMEIPANTQDVLSALYTVRGMQLAPGKSVWVQVVADGRAYNAEVRVLRRETEKTIFGKIPCLVIEPVLKGEAIFKQTGQIFIWLTDDKWHIPVKVQSKIVFGSFYAVLDDADQVALKIEKH